MRTRAIIRGYLSAATAFELHSFFRKPTDRSHQKTTAAMNPIPIFTVFLVLGAAAIIDVSGLPNYVNPSAMSSEDCARSEVYSTCQGNPMCQPTCDNQNGLIACSRSGGLEGNMCYPGCVCKKGFVRVAVGDQCIPIDKCQGRVKH
ncbi:uncharacterized protein LOC124404874 [Diprion similis]|uniref:uncharacterized protein LOC124404874 n=1 Tax=Diprion similis TaxID=362088 RepID=UPI001EF97F8E|nr:uncharacterized protein LOC124404874 [Diprion similis]